MVRNNVVELGCNEALFKTVVKTSFGQRRKTLRNSLRPLLPPGCTLSDDDTIGNLRPEQLSVEQFIELTRRIDGMRKKELLQ